MPPSKKPKQLAPPAKYRVRIRMYRQGLGDCFLLTFPKPAGDPVHLMIDCGVVLGTNKPDVIMTKVVEHIRTETKNKVDVLVITHEHWDHLSGFTKGQAQAVFDKINFDTLWMAWTEKSGQPLAEQLRRDHAAKKAAAKASKEKLAKSKAKGDQSRAQRMSALMEFFGAASKKDGKDGGEGAEGTQGALKYLKDKIANQRTFEPGQAPVTIPGVAGVRVFVLGPPMDAQALGSTDPRKGEGFGLASRSMSLASAFAAGLGIEEVNGDRERAQPFAASFREKIPTLSSHPYCRSQDAWRRIDTDWLSVGERLALQLDSDTNNTSLVLAFELMDTQEVLLFVGDAQAGNWRSWEALSWKVKNTDGTQAQVSAFDLLERTVFYKVGHHGSHNATLREKGLAKMTNPELVAMIPVDEKVAHDVKNWKHMPLPALRTQLKKQCAAVIQSDTDTVSGTKPGTKPILTDPLFFDYYL